MPYQTDERLKSYLDTNQLYREQLALAVLALDKRFSEVRPRHPRGGPDGGRDIQATYRGQESAFGAVGFVNQADDSAKTKRLVRKKFLSDLAAATRESPGPDVFVFITNVNFTLSEKDQFVELARTKGLAHCELFDRERIRIALDSADGFAIRFQLLGIPLSEAEQASFFAKWGDDINSVIATGFQKIQETLDHLLFYQESIAPVTSFQMALELDREYLAEEVGHFRVFCSVFLQEPKLRIVSLVFGSSDKADRFVDSSESTRTLDLRPGLRHGMSGAQWEMRLDEKTGTNDRPLAKRKLPSPDRYRLTGSSSGIGEKQVRFLSARYWTNDFLRFEPVLSLNDFDGCQLLPILNKSLAQKVKTLHVLSNGYKLLEVSRHEFSIDESSFDCHVPMTLDSIELQDPWVRLRPKRASAFSLSFTDTIPHRLFESRRARNTLPARKPRPTLDE